MMTSESGRFGAVASLILFAFVAPSAVFAQESAPASKPAVRGAAVSEIDLEAAKSIKAEDLKRDLTFIASDELEGRATPSRGQTMAGDFIAKMFTAANLKFYGNGSYFQPVKLSRVALELAQSTERVANVVGVLEGTDPNAPAIVFSAHYDHLGRAKKALKRGDDIYNGADDDGSGTVAVMALARAYAARKEKPKHTLVFACFTGEEIGGYGSRAYVNAPPVPLSKTLCNINLEMLGRTHEIGEKRSWMTGWDYSTLGEVMAEGAKAAGVEIYPDPYPSENFYVRSDNTSFIVKNVMGHSFSAGSTHPQYHTVEDEVRLIEFTNLEALVRGIYLGSSLIASGAETPAPKKASLLPEEMQRPPKRPESSPANH